MAGTVTVAETRIGSIHKLKFDWTSDASGNADQASTSIFTGRIVLTAQVPGTAGVQPTNAYDVTVLDSDNVDVLNALGANLSNAATTQSSEKDGLGAVAHSLLTLHVINAGNAKSGSTILYVKVT